MKKKNLFVIVCVILLFLCFGFFSQKYSLFQEKKQKTENIDLHTSEPKDRNQDDKVSNEKKDDFPSAYKKKKGKVIFDTKIEKPEHLTRDNLQGYGITLQRFDFKKAYKEFFSNQQLIDKTEDFNDSENKMAYYEGEDRSSLNLNEDSGMLITSFAIYVNRCFDLHENKDKFSLNESLDFMSGEKAYQKIKESLDEIGFYLGEDSYYKWYSLEYQKLKKYEYVMDKEGEIDQSQYKPSWGKEDDCYYFIIYQTCQGLKIHTYYDNYMKVMDDETAPVQVIYSKNGIQYIDFTKSFSMKPEDYFYSLKPWTEIADNLIHKYNQVIGDSYYEFHNVQLVFLAQEKNLSYELRPAWIIDGVEKEENEEESNFQLAIDAETGENIY